MKISLKTNITPNANGDSRTADHIPTIEEFKAANLMHINDVNHMAVNVAAELKARIKLHDWTKTTEPYQTMFYNDLCEAIKGNIIFGDGEWAKLHYEEKERHHLTKHVPDDVDLFDVFEMLIDCVCAGMARSGGVYPIDIPDEVLSAAVKNTIKELEGSVNIVTSSTVSSSFVKCSSELLQESATLADFS